MLKVQDLGILNFHPCEECSGSVVECFTWDTGMNIKARIFLLVDLRDYCFYQIKGRGGGVKKAKKTGLVIFRAFF